MASAPNHMMDAAWAPCISSLPFFASSSLTLFPPPSSVFTSSVSVFGSLIQPPDVVRLHHLSSLLGTDTIFTLTSYWPRYFFHSFIYSFYPFPPPAPLLWSPLALTSPRSPGAFYTLPLQSKRLGLSEANSQPPVP